MGAIAFCASCLVLFRQARSFSSSVSFVAPISSFLSTLPLYLLAARVSVTPIPHHSDHSHKSDVLYFCLVRSWAVSAQTTFAVSLIPTTSGFAADLLSPRCFSKISIISKIALLFCDPTFFLNSANFASSSIC